MQAYQRAFIEFILKHQALKFGDFTLKSGRKSPYFFNAGIFHTGEALSDLGHYYAAAITNSKIPYDMLFGPAYKGIPLVCTTAISLAKEFKHNIPYCFNRKEAKDHGEGGNIVGAPLSGKVLIIDDVITAGTAFRESWQLISAAKAQLAGVVIALDRQERGQNTLSAIDEIKQSHKIEVISIIKLQHVLEYLDEQKTLQDIQKKLYAYLQAYGSSLS